MALDSEIEALAAQADGSAQNIARQIERWRRDSRTIRSYRALCLDESGNLKPEAVEVIADLSRVAQLGRVVPPAATDAEVREYNGRRTTALHFIERIDLSGAKLRKLATKLRERGE